MPWAKADAVVLLIPGNHITFAPRFSPDGRNVVFSMANGGNTDIYVVNADGGVPQRLTTLRDGHVDVHVSTLEESVDQKVWIIGSPEEVAHMTVNLCMPASSFVNGAIIPVDGGWLAR